MVARKPAGPEPCGRAGRGKRRAETWNGRAETARPTIVPPMSQGERNLLVPRRDLRTWARARQDDQEDQEGRHRHRAGTQGPQGEVTMNKRDGSTIDSLFEELGELEEVNARTAKKILAIETERRMKKLGLSTTDLARRMGTSRNQIHRILDEGDAGITLKMLFRLAGALGMPLQVGFGPPGLERAHVRSSKGLRCASIGQRAGEGICSILYGVQPPWAGRSTGSTEALTMVRRAHRTESGRRDLNPRRPPWQGGTLPLSYSRELTWTARDVLVARTIRRVNAPRTPSPSRPRAVPARCPAAAAPAPHATVRVACEPMQTPGTTASQRS